MNRIFVFCLALVFCPPAYAGGKILSADHYETRNALIGELAQKPRSYNQLQTAGSISDWCTRHPESFVCVNAAAATDLQPLSFSDNPFCPEDKNQTFDGCFGDYEFSDGGKYVGMWAEDSPDQRGVRSFADGDIYIGEYQEGKFHGKGSYIATNGTVYFGDWVNDEPSVGGLELFGDGDVYIGEYQEGKFHGEGVYVFADGEKIYGEFTAGKILRGTQYSPQGKVLGTYKNGEWCDGCKSTQAINQQKSALESVRTISYKDGTYTGTTQEGAPHGAGVYQDAKGRRYLGQWNKAIIEGEGVFIVADKLVYVGSFQQENFTNFGIRQLSSGETYFGQWEDSKRHGPGIATFTDGDKYVGQFSEDKIAGHGIYRSSTGKTFVGTSKDNNPWNAIIYANSGEVLGTVVDGEYCNACQPEQSTNIHLTKPPLERKLIGTGTGFIISDRYIATAEHVVDDCHIVKIIHNRKEFKTSVIATSEGDDLAVLRSHKTLSNIAYLRGPPALRMGEMAVNFGYPLYSTLSAGAKVTSGIVNALAGYENATNQFQYDAATQFGNSGGPVLDKAGNVIGVVSAKLDDADTQLVNFAMKASTLEAFLSSNQIPFSKAPSNQKLDIPEIAQKASRFTVLVGCFD